MQTDKKQLAVVIALSLVLGVAVLYSVKKSMGVPPPGGGATATDSAPSTEGSPGDTAAAATSAAGPDAPQALEYRFVGNPPRDPFEPRLLGPSSEQSTGIVVAPRSSPGSRLPKNQRVAWNLGQGGSLPPWQPGGGVTGNLSVQAPDSAAARPEPDRPPFKMTGVIKGSQSMAILRGEGGGRYFVRQGQTLGDGYVVSAISQGGVVLKSKDRRIFLKLGGAQEAATTNGSR